MNHEVLLHNRSDFELYQQIFVKNVFNLSSIQELMKKNDPVVYDLGANSGFFSFRILDFFPKAKIYAFEPQIKVNRRFKETIKANNLEDRIVLHEFAVAESNTLRHSTKTDRLFLHLY